MTRILNTLDATTSTLLTSQPTIFQDDPLDDLTAVLFRFTEVVHDWLSEPPTPALQPAVDLILPVFF